MAIKHYDDSFYGYQLNDSLLSAKELVPYVNEIFEPKSVIDIGCGLGSWLVAFKDLYKINDIRGVDGSYVKIDKLCIPHENFISHDLTKPYHANRQFDLAISLEVGEHLPDSAADDFVKSLAQSSRKILFFGGPSRAGRHLSH